MTGRADTRSGKEHERTYLRNSNKLLLVKQMCVLSQSNAPAVVSRTLSLVIMIFADPSLVRCQQSGLTDALGPRLGVLQVERVGRFKSAVLCGFAARRDADQRLWPSNWSHSYTYESDMMSVVWCLLYHWKRRSKVLSSRWSMQEGVSCRQQRLESDE